VGRLTDSLQFNVSSTRIAQEALGLRIEGELDLCSAPEMREEVAAIPTDVRFVLADLTGLTFMDSTGVAILIDVARLLGERLGLMMLVVDNARLVRVLEETGLDEYFEIRPDFDSAMHEFAGLTGG
jgi:anti-sigma B factor antagonist